MLVFNNFLPLEAANRTKSSFVSAHSVHIVITGIIILIFAVIFCLLYTLFLCLIVRRSQNSLSEKKEGRIIWQEFFLAAKTLKSVFIPAIIHDSMRETLLCLCSL